MPHKPDGVVIVTRPEVTMQIVKECAELGIPRVWIHDGMHGVGTSVSVAAVEFCHQQGLAAIPGGCPMRYCPHADFGHRLMRWMQGGTGGLPRQV